MSQQKKTVEQPDGWASTPEEIATLRTMDITLFSGAKVTIRSVSLTDLALADALPASLLFAVSLERADMLLPAIIQEARNEKPEEAKRLTQAGFDLAERLCRMAIVSPEPTDALLDALSTLDKELIVDISQRKRAVDAAGKKVGASLADFDQFRIDTDGSTDSRESGDGRMDALVA